MQTTVTERGQISIPAAIRKHYHLKPGMGIEWLVTDEGIYLLPVPKDPIAAFRGSSKGLLKALLEDRRKDREKEREQEKKRWKNTSSTRRP